MCVKNINQSINQATN